MATYLTALNDIGVMGSSVGYYMALVDQVMDLQSTFMTFYRDCNVNYAISSLGRKVQTINGLLDTVVNVLFRSFGDDTSTFTTC
mmetsp:Transcript_39849/g.29399  ORF Transcript_39849/g.29399 Transcript_39849/m.29399 type:complete len:84 (+) Transcript_39849:267-518(+)